LRAAEPAGARNAEDAMFQVPDVSFSDEEAGAMNAPQSGDDLADQAIGGGETKGQEKREGFNSEEAAREGGDWGREAVEKSAVSTGVVEGEAARADILEHDAKGLGAGEAMEGEGKEAGGGGVGLTVAMKMTIAPHVIQLLREHEFGKALEAVWNSVTYEERAEFLKYVSEKVAGELSRKALERFAIIAIGAGLGDVLKLGWDWTSGGLMAMYEAHEKGERDSRINIYAWAWSETVLTGHHSNPGAVGAEAVEAKEEGIKDGLATREQSPDLPSLLLAQYKTVDNARHALEDALLKRAGITNIRTHQ
jgi:hypothetical protein